MNVADEVDVGGQVPQHALAAVGAVAADDELPVREPGGHHGQHLAEQLGPGAVVGVGRPLLALAALGQPLAVAVQAAQDRQAPDLARRPEAADDQAEDDPVVSPAEHLQGPAGHERVVVHAGPVEG